mmetsp:Transcript_15089/g.32787  ORF Transcript_15089/g.32787 Transcript_15089/m.32787 type:complete len:242 (+) Transcript_15089:831-1556(+)
MRKTKKRGSAPSRRTSSTATTATSPHPCASTPSPPSRWPNTWASQTSSSSSATSTACLRMTASTTCRWLACARAPTGRTCNGASSCLDTSSLEPTRRRRSTGTPSSSRWLASRCTLLIMLVATTRTHSRPGTTTSSRTRTRSMLPNTRSACSAFGRSSWPGLLSLRVRARRRATRLSPTRTSTPFRAIPSVPRTLLQSDFERAALVLRVPCLAPITFNRSRSDVRLFASGWRTPGKTAVRH